ncbi:hypothetical protein TrCOL_g9256 [Triparma columacea]|uniref:Casein kinase I n=1 Tax=Triparma columacea TaxID=722753 RepID=A0A9W7G1Y5_9STRA|nr:hypothetical protein TrCOL_g9256 [Triparma columacea]
MSRPLINNYRITKRVGGGSFGDIYLGVGANGEKVAVKFEKHGARCPQLRHEYKVYRELANAPGFAKVHYFGTQDSYNLMVMDLLGPSLEDQFNKCGRRFSLKTVLLLADQMLERVELMHSRHLIHRDIKPANFVTDREGGDKQIVYCIDFGLSKRYRHPRTLQHIPAREGRSLTGTPRYASINNHLGVEQSRRDDLESIGYVLIYFLKGGLPWQGLKAKSASKKYKLIMEKKQSTSIPNLCTGCPNQFAEYLAYCRSLKFEAKPNISYLRGMFRDLFRSQGYTQNMEWDWSRIDDPRFVASGTGTAKDKGAGGGQQDPNDDVEILNEQPMMDVDRNLDRPDTAAAVGRPDTAAAVRPGTSGTLGGTGTSRRATAPTQFYEGADGGNSGHQQGYTGGGASSGGGWGHGQTTYTGSSSNRNAGGSNPRPATASRVNTSSSKNTTGTPGTRPSTAYGLRTSGTAKTSSIKRGGEGGTNPHDQHVVAGARGMMRYRRTRAATDGQVGEGGHAWNSSLPNNNGRGLLQRKDQQATAAWDHRPGTTGTRGTYSSGKYDSRVSGSKRQQTSSRR